MMIFSNMRDNIIFHKNYLFIILLLSIAGCSTFHAKSMNMIPSTYELQKVHKHSIIIQVDEGRKKDFSYNYALSAETFKEALEKSIIKSGVFSNVIKEGNAEYLLKISIRSLAEPGPSMSVFPYSLVLIWELQNLQSKEVIWKDLITSTFTAPYSGTATVGLAIEGACRENIQMGISEISRLNLQ